MPFPLRFLSIQCKMLARRQQSDVLLPLAVVLLCTTLCSKKETFIMKIRVVTGFLLAVNIWATVQSASSKPPQTHQTVTEPVQPAKPTLQEILSWMQQKINDQSAVTFTLEHNGGTSRGIISDSTRLDFFNGCKLQFTKGHRERTETKDNNQDWILPAYGESFTASIENLDLLSLDPTSVKVVTENHATNGWRAVGPAIFYRVEALTLNNQELIHFSITSAIKRDRANSKADHIAELSPDQKEGQRQYLHIPIADNALALRLSDGLRDAIIACGGRSAHKELYTQQTGQTVNGQPSPGPVGDSNANLHPEAQQGVKSAYLRSDTTSTVVSKYVHEHFLTCGTRIFATEVLGWRAPYEYKDFAARIQNDPVLEVDRMNGLEVKATVFLTARFARRAFNNKWGGWMQDNKRFSFDKEPEIFSITSFQLFKRSGQWSVLESNAYTVDKGGCTFYQSLRPE